MFLGLNVQHTTDMHLKMIRNKKTVFTLPVSLLNPLLTALKLLAILMSLTVLTSLASCGFNNPKSSPDVIYSESSNEAKALQIPPDLTNVSNGEQFILPGLEAGPLARNRLLPEFAGARYVRQQDQNWLELNQSAESVWPLVLEFIDKQKLVVEKTAPTTGLIFTQWRAETEKNGGLLKNLISGDEVYSRYAFRLERNNTSTRLFVRSMQVNADALESVVSDLWPASSHNPEQVAQILTQLLVFLGAEQQQAQGILSEPQANAIIDDAEVQTTAAGSQLLIHKGFSPSFNEVKDAVNNLKYNIVLSDDSVGVIQAAPETSTEPLLFSLTPVHVSAVRVLVTQQGGGRLAKDKELTLLTALKEQII